VARDERRWSVVRRLHKDTALTGRYDGLTPIEDVFTGDEIAWIDAHVVGGGAA
jgi:manganese/zinc/iron transport system permease protein